jgi:putative transposase
MGKVGYIWRKLTPKQRGELLAWRKRRSLPWHRPPHHPSDKTRFHITAACFEHRDYIGHSSERIEAFCGRFLETLSRRGLVHAWCVLPNHYHALIETTFIAELLSELGKMHGSLSYQWNGEEDVRGRQVWCGVAERYMRNDHHFWATLNYVHNNPVRHGYVRRWQEWPYSSAEEYLASFGPVQALRIWKDYPILEYGKGWDDPHL